MIFGLDYSWWAFLFFIIVVAFAIVFSVLSKKWKKKIPEQQRKFYLKIWNSLGQKSHKEAIMEADKILDKLLGHKGYSGSLGERLKKADGVFSDLNGTWEAHKLRNKLAHELDFQVSADVFHKTMKSFEKAYKDLGLFS